MIWARWSRASGSGAALAAALSLLLGALAAQETLPEDVETTLARAEAALKNGDLTAARHLSDRAQALAPNDPRASLLVGHVLFAMGEAENGGLLARPSFADAATSYEEALALGADPYQAGYWAAEARERSRERDKAIADIERALLARPKDPAALGLKGRLLLDSGKPALAVAVLDEAVALAPGTPAAADAAVDSIRARLKVGDLAALPAAFEKLTRKDPHGAAARICQLVWENLHDTKNEDVWSSMLEAAAKAEPDDKLVTYYRAELAVRRKEGAAALSLIERYLALAPADPVGHVIRSTALRLLGRLDEARVEIGKAYDLDHEREATRQELRYLVAAFFAARRYRDAADVQELVVHITGSPADRHDYAVLRLDAGMKADADRIYREIAADPEVPPSERARASNALALLLRSRGRPEDAEKAFRAAIEDDPGNLDAHENLGILLVHAGRVEEGKRELAVSIAKNQDPLPRKRSIYHLWRASHPEVP